MVITLLLIKQIKAKKYETPDHCPFVPDDNFCRL